MDGLGQTRQLAGVGAEGVAPLTLMCVLARLRRLSVVWRVLSGPRGTSCFSCSRYSLSLARLQEPETELSGGQPGPQGPGGQAAERSEGRPSPLHPRGLLLRAPV